MGQQLAAAYERAVQRGHPLTPDADADKLANAQLEKEIQSRQNTANAAIAKAKKTVRLGGYLPRLAHVDDLPAHVDHRGRLRFSPSGLDDVRDRSSSPNEQEQLVYSD